MPFFGQSGSYPRDDGVVDDQRGACIRRLRNDRLGPTTSFDETCHKSASREERRVQLEEAPVRTFEPKATRKSTTAAPGQVPPAARGRTATTSARPRPA